ncbi:Ig-like domain-containing protein [Rhodococcus sp. NPDC004095]
MFHPVHRAVVMATGCSAIVTGTVLLGIPAGATTTVTNFIQSCQAKSIITVDKTVTSSLTLTAPDTVEAGSTFTYRIQPGASSFPDKDSGAVTSNLSRIKFDFALPDNATFTSARVVPDTAVGLDAVTPNVLRINDIGEVDDNGPILRLSGNNEVIGNGADNSTTGEGGIRVPKTKRNLDGSTNVNGETWYQLPAVEVTMVAGVGGVIEPKVRTGGTASTYASDTNFHTYLAKQTPFSTLWLATRCIPSDDRSTPNTGAAPLATITITDPVIMDTTTALSVPAAATTGEAVDLRALVRTSDDTDAVGGTVQFQDNGSDIGGPVALVDGAAKMVHAFTTAGSHSIIAAYSGGAGFKESTSSASTVTVSDATTPGNPGGGFGSMEGLFGS